MRHIFIILFALCILHPAYAQVTGQELSDKLDKAIREAQRKHREEVMAKQRQEQQREAEVENRTQLGLQQNKQQTQRLQENYGVDDLRQRNINNRPSKRNVAKVKITKIQSRTPDNTGGVQADGNERTEDDTRSQPYNQRPCITPHKPRPPRVPTGIVPGNRQPVVYRAPLGQFPPRPAIKQQPPSSFRSADPVKSKQSGVPAKRGKMKNEDDFFCPKNKRVQNINWRDLKPGLCTKDVGITAAVLRYNKELMYKVGNVNGRFSTQGLVPLIVVKRGDYYIVKSSRVLRKK